MAVLKTNYRESTNLRKAAPEAGRKSAETEVTKRRQTFFSAPNSLNQRKNHKQFVQSIIGATEIRRALVSILLSNKLLQVFISRYLMLANLNQKFEKWINIIPHGEVSKMS